MAADGPMVAIVAIKDVVPRRDESRGVDLP
jgi:hypothetical protein